MTQLSHFDNQADTEDKHNQFWRKKLENEHGLEEVAADMPVGHWGGGIIRKGSRGIRWELLTAPRELNPLGQLRTSSTSIVAVPISQAEDPVSPMTQTSFCLISLNSLRTATGKPEPWFDSLTPSLMFLFLKYTEVPTIYQKPMQNVEKPHGMKQLSSFLNKIKYTYVHLRVRHLPTPCQFNSTEKDTAPFLMNSG